MDHGTGDPKVTVIGKFCRLVESANKILNAKVFA